MLAKYHKRTSTSVEKPASFFLIQYLIVVICLNSFNHSHINGCICFLWLLLTIYYKLGGLKTQKLIFSQFWMPEVQDQGVNRATSPPKALGRNGSFSFWTSGGSWCFLACRCIIQSLPLSSHGCVPSVSLSSSLRHKDTLYLICCKDILWSFQKLVIPIICKYQRLWP